MQGPGPQRWEREKRSWREAGCLSNRGKGAFCLLLPFLSWRVTLLPKSSAIRGGSICYWTSAFLEGLSSGTSLGTTSYTWTLEVCLDSGKGAALSPQTARETNPVEGGSGRPGGPQLFRPLDGSFRELCSTQADAADDGLLFSLHGTRL